jgi:hypothetical protein
MARPSLDLGTAGAVRVYPVPTGGYRAMTRYRDWDGTVRLIERRGATKGAATRALTLAIRDRSRAGSASDITPDTKVAVLAEQWFSEVSSGSLSPSTVEVYGDMLRRLIIPALGNLRVRELTVGSVEQTLTRRKAANWPSTAEHRACTRQKGRGMTASWFVPLVVCRFCCSPARSLLDRGVPVASVSGHPNFSSISLSIAGGCRSLGMN